MNEEGKFVTAVRQLRADRVVPISSNDLRGLRKAGKRLGHEMANCRCCKHGNREACSQHEGGDEAKALGAAGDIARFGEQVNSTDRLALKYNAASQQNVPALC